MTPFEQVKQFHQKFGLAVNEPFSHKLLQLRDDLLEEEHREVDDEYYSDDPDFESFYKKTYLIDRKKLTKELADLLYVTYGFAVTFGLPIEEVFNEVHRSNMSKLGEDGRPIYREDGKVLKGPNYKEANLDQFFGDTD